MVLWFSLAILTGLAVLALLWPLARAGRSAEADDAVFYRQELADIARDQERGLIAAAEADAARAEAGRRLLAARRLNSDDANPASSPMRLRAAALVVLIAIPLIALPLYLRIASPELPDQPLASRAGETQGVEDAVVQIEKHLASNPNDGRGYEVVAPVYMQMGRFDDAVRSLSEALRILGPTASRYAALGQARVAQAGGIVTSAARDDFEKAVALDKQDMRARFFLALASEQDGDKTKALEAFQKLAAETDPASPIGQTLAAKIAELQPQSSAGATIAALPKDDQTKMIRAMVAGLAQKLETNGNDIDGWLRLIRAYVVLGDKKEAADAVAKAKTALGSNADALKRIDALARDMQIGSTP